jgi:hypothetical protein
MYDVEALDRLVSLSPPHALKPISIRARARRGKADEIELILNLSGKPQPRIPSTF